MNREISNTLSNIYVAPMLDWTDRHCRYFLRLISPNIHLYSEMVTTGAIIYGESDRFLRFSEVEQPITLQLGGSNPEEMAKCAKIGEDYGYNEININCGCPSDRVQNGNFGACLMADPGLVAKCVEEMQKVVNIPVSVKCRIAIDDYEETEFLNNFIKTVSETGCSKFIIHARKALLGGLSPKQNREIPPLRYDLVEEIKQKYPHLEIVINGGFKTIDDIKQILKNLDGVMIGREAYQNPYFLAAIENQLFSNSQIKTREEVALEMIPYIEQQQRDYDTPVRSITRHILGLFQGQSGAKLWRRTLSEGTKDTEFTAKIIEHALSGITKTHNLAEIA